VIKGLICFLPVGYSRKNIFAVRSIFFSGWLEANAADNFGCLARSEMAQADAVVNRIRQGTPRLDAKEV